MAKIKKRINSSLVNISLKYSFGETINLSEYARILESGYYGLLIPKSINGRTLHYESFNGKLLNDYLSSGLSIDEVIKIIEQLLLVVLELDKIGLQRSSIVMELNNIFVCDNSNEVKMICSSAVLKDSDKTIAGLIHEVLENYSTSEFASLDFRRKFLSYLERFDDEDIFRIEDYLANENKKAVLEIRDNYYTRLYRKLSSDQVELDNVNAIRQKIDFEKSNNITEDSPTYVMDDDKTGFMDSMDNETTGIYNYMDDNELQNDYEEDELTDYFEIEQKTVNEVTESDKHIFDKKKTKEHAAGPVLIRKANNEVIYINKTNFRLGREEGSVDYCIYDNKKISRAHADLFIKGGKWNIVDLKSKNRTYVNDRVLPASVEIPLNDGDIIRLNTEEFVFKCK